MARKKIEPKNVKAKKVEVKKGEVTKVEEITKQVTDLFDKDNIFHQITTRAADGALAKFHTFDDKSLAKIASGMPEINRATRSLGRRNTQTTNKLMSLTMLADASPYRAIRQCLSQIENKRNAIKENRFKILRDKVTLEKLYEEIGKLYEDPEADKYDIQLKEIELEELNTKIADSMLYVEGALKELASFQSSYQQICRNNDIPQNWDEEHLEKAEVRHHLRMAFLHAYRDIMANGRLGMGTLEYLQQFGVHPHVADSIVKGYIQSTYKKTAAGEKVDYEDLEKFLDVVEEHFKDAYKGVLKRIGLDSLYENWYMYEEDEEKDIEE